MIGIVGRAIFRQVVSGGDEHKRAMQKLGEAVDDLHRETTRFSRTASKTLNSTRVEVKGLRELQRELRAMGPEWARELRLANREAAEVIATAARSSFGSRLGSAPKVVPTIRALAQQRNASVKIGGGSSVGGQVAMGNEFGSVRFSQFPAPAPGGLSLYPAIKAKRGEVMDTYEKAIDRVTRRAFPK